VLRTATTTGKILCRPLAATVASELIVSADAVRLNHAFVNVLNISVELSPKG